jgi:probable blue pigment (indigoidine) exporter
MTIAPFDAKRRLDPRDRRPPSAALRRAPLALASTHQPSPFTVTTTGAYLALVARAVAFLVWFRGIERLPAAAVGLASPLTGAGLGWLLLGQSLSPTQLVGFAITLATIAYAAQSVAEPARCVQRPRRVAGRLTLGPIPVCAFRIELSARGGEGV